MLGPVRHLAEEMRKSSVRSLRQDDDTWRNFEVKAFEVREVAIMRKKHRAMPQGHAIDLFVRRAMRFRLRNAGHNKVPRLQLFNNLRLEIEVCDDPKTPIITEGRKRI